jgi:PAS domain S-box-containing protein
VEAVFQLISATSDGVFAVDRRQCIVLWNDAANSILGYEAKEVVGRYCYKILPAQEKCCEDGCRKGCTTLRSALSGRPKPTRDMMARTKSGRTVCLNMTTMLVPSAWKKLSLLVHLFRDVTEQKRAEEVVHEMLDRVSEAMPHHQHPDLAHLRAQEPTIDLTEREREILRALSTGASTETIARRLGISPITVRNHIQNVLGKLGVHSRLEAVTFSLRNGLL